ncbi:hypothetical protein [Xenorhabdus innexi]|uniref:Uncharacterized protein n=1 Tax=Xenorhabdus innexi TaxID=290109 RepID=A0A1N6MQI3_9GAMM|nr:hypothetical protein [Xenorhabdus innexi]PHM36101.1 hypothetical protein Xinn_01817 [Xenorhabdus innexi]SIP71014.1 conserved exported hypothetical protein [Xenorhabdus innexi]
MRLLTKISLFSFILLMSFPSVAGLSTPKEIIQQIKERGASSVVAEIGEKNEANEIAKFITSGDPDWLKVAFQLTPNIHRDFSNQLLNSLSLALITNPVEVLAQAKKHRPDLTNNICHPSLTSIQERKKPKFIQEIVASLKAAEKSAKRKDKENIESCILKFNQTYPGYF